MIEMSVDSVRINLATQQRVVILKAVNQDRYMFIWIAQAEAYAIAVHVQGTISPRPLTHDLLKNIVEGMGAKVMRIVISELIDEVFYAQIILNTAGQEIEMDARPSDAIALAVRVNAPIFVAEEIIERSGVSLDQQDEASTSSTEVDKGEQKLTEEDEDVAEEQKQANVDSDVTSDPAEATMLKERLAQLEEELREARKRITELEESQGRS
jgi:bifunctional DNase/RNase